MPPSNTLTPIGAAEPLPEFLFAGAFHPLTRREIEVARWITAGKRNREIAKILDCTYRTAEKHVENILFKLDVAARTAICGWFLERLTQAGYWLSAPVK
jgi:DNA-binding CsgD family transcriptional regulator